MDKDLLDWIINELDEERLKNICKKKKIKIDGFRSIQKAPKYLVVRNLMKNRTDLISYFKNLADISEEKSEFENKEILEIEGLIDIKNKEKMIEQLIYLVTRNSVEYTELASKIIDKVKKIDDKNEISITDENEENKNFADIDNLNKTIKAQKTKLAQLKSENKLLTAKNQGINVQITITF